MEMSGKYELKKKKKCLSKKIKVIENNKNSNSPWQRPVRDISG